MLKIIMNMMNMMNKTNISKSIRIAIKFPTFYDNKIKKLKNCTSCRHYDLLNNKCKIFSINIQQCRTNINLCYYDAKYFEPDTKKVNSINFVSKFFYMLLIYLKKNIENKTNYL
jgi:hypothetical protein